MKSGTCPKCNAGEIHIIPGNRTDMSLPISAWRVSFTTVYCCVTCGYLEMYVEDAEDLPRIAERWPKVKR